MIYSTAKKMKFSFKDFSFLRIWSHLLKKSLIENFIFCAVKMEYNPLNTARKLNGYVRRSEGFLEVFWMSYIRAIYVQKEDFADLITQ